MNGGITSGGDAYKVVAILRDTPAQAVLSTAQALYEGGIRALELTFPQREPERFPEIVRQIALLRQRFDGRMFIGAGTVIAEKQAELAHEAGAQFIVSPDAQERVIRRTKELGMLSLPGAMTPTEILTAYRWGADMVKVFPAGALGTAYIRAIRAPISHVPLLAVGGISSANAAEFMKAGVVGVGAGGELVDKKAIAEGRFDRLTEAAKMLIQAVTV